MWHYTKLNWLSHKRCFCKLSQTGTLYYRSTDAITAQRFSREQVVPDKSYALRRIFSDTLGSAFRPFACYISTRCNNRLYTGKFTVSYRLQSDELGAMGLEIAGNQENLGCGPSVGLHFCIFTLPRLLINS